MMRFCCENKGRNYPVNPNNPGNPVLTTILYEAMTAPIEPKTNPNEAVTNPIEPMTNPNEAVTTPKAMTNPNEAPTQMKR
ncbi:MAG: hypothetical protein IPK11_02450 [Ignavibacteria bacterium]|nr:hypothetical protein [Ignavibacteria bacterium]